MYNQSREISLVIIIIFLIVTLFAGIRIHDILTVMNTQIATQRTMLSCIGIKLNSANEDVKEKLNGLDDVI